MTDAPTCQTCFHYSLIDDRPRCKRHQLLRDGRLQMQRKGWTVQFERDGIPEPQRAEGDKCGPDGIHWRSRL